MTRQTARLNLLLLAFMLVVISLTSCPSSEEPQTPRDAFMATLARVEARDYKSEWRFMTDRLKHEWGTQVNARKQDIRAQPGNRAAQDQMLMQLFELNADEYLKADPRLLHARYLEVNRQSILRYEVLRDARIEDGVAELPVQLLKGDQPTNFRYVLVDGQWLLDEGIRGR